MKSIKSKKIFIFGLVLFVFLCFSTSNSQYSSFLDNINDNSIRQEIDHKEENKTEQINTYNENFIPSYSSDQYPQINWSTYLGGDSYDEGYSIAVNPNTECIYVTGYTRSTNFPIKNAYQSSNMGRYDVFISKFNSDGSLNWSSYFGGAGEDYGDDIAVDPISDTVIVAGRARSTNFPTKSPYQGSNGGGYCDGFIAKFNSDGTLNWSTYLGGNNDDSCFGVAVDSLSGCVYVTGTTLSSNFPILSAFQTSIIGNYDAFIAKFNVNGNLLWSSYLGGNSTDEGNSITLNPLTGDAFITGRTDSPNFPIQNAFQTTSGGSTDVFISKINSIGSLDWSSYLGGNSSEYGMDIVFHSINQTVLVTGYTYSINFPIYSGYQSDYQGSRDIFISNFNLDGSINWSSFFGGSSYELANSIFVNSNTGMIYLTGYTSSSNFPIKNAFQKTQCGTTWDVFITVFSVYGSLEWSSYIGSSGTDVGYGIAMNPNSGNVYITGQASASDFPTKNAYQSIYGGSGDTIVLKITPQSYTQYGYEVWNQTWDNSNKDNFGNSIWSDGNYIYTVGSDTKDYSILLIKWTTTGSIIWNRTWNTDGQEWGTGICGNGTDIYTCGWYTPYGQGKSDIIVTRWDSNGNQIWNVSWGGGDIEESGKISLLNDNLFIAGWAQSWGQTHFLLKIFTNGTIDWYRTWGGGGSTPGEYGSICITSSWIYTCGYLQMGASNPDIYLIKWDMQGNINWTRTWGGSTFDGAIDIWANDSEVYIVGYSTSYANGNFVIVKWNSDGTEMWNRIGYGGEYSNRLNSITIYDNSLYTLGYISSTITQSKALLLIKWDLNGNQIWNRTKSRLYNQEGYALWVNSSSILTLGRIQFIRNGVDNYDLLLISWNETNALNSPILNEITPNPNTSGNVVLNWNAVDCASTYKIYRSTQNIYSLHGATFLTETSELTYSDLNLCSATYYYVVIAKDGYTESKISNCQQVVVNTVSNIAPTMNVTDALIFAVGTTNNVMSWTPYDDNVASGTYILEDNFMMDIIEKGYWKSGIPIIINFDYLGIGTFYYNLYVYDGYGSSKMVNVQITVTYPPPIAPTLDAIMPNPSTTGNITLNWNDVIGASGYYVYRDLAPITDVSGLMPIGNPVSSDYFDLSLSNGTYYYSIIACNASGNSSISNVRQVNVEVYVPNDNQYQMIVASPIIIDGTSGTQNWSNSPYVNGSGTFYDPYIIQNLQIDASGGTNCISISNTNQFYRILNCILSNTGNTLGCAGILLNNANNGVIQKCTLFNNQYGAINAKKCDNLLIDDNNLTANYFGVLIDCNHSIVSNNLVMNNPVGIQTESGTSTYNCTIIHNTCIGGSAGIRVWGQFHTISNNTCSSNTQCGILASGFNHTIQYNTISNCQWGIWLPDGICDNNSISDNTCVNNTQYGIYLSGYYDEFSKVGDYSEFNLVSNNNCSLNTICGIFVFGSPQNYLVGNIGTIQLNVYPDPPQNVNAIPGDYQIQLTWQPPLSNGGLSITGYLLYRGLTEESKMLLVELGNVTNYLDTTGLVNGQIYYYHLVAQNNAGLSLNSTSTFAQSGNVSTVPQINSPLDQSWDFATTNHFIEWMVIDDTIGTTSYLIYQNGTNVDTGVWVSGNYFSIDIDGLSVGSYNYTCIAFDGLGESTQDTIIVNVQNVNPVVNHPSDMIFVLGTSGHSILWTPTDSSTYATPKYSIWRNGTCVLNGNWSSGNNISLSVDDIFEGTWNIEIQINDGYPSGNASDIVIVTVVSNNPPSLTAPADQSFILGTLGRTISWMVTDSEMSSTSYTLYRNNTLIGTGSWVNGSIIPVALDGLSLGSYNFTLIVNDGLSLGITQDTVWITIFTNLLSPPTLNPILPNPNTNGTLMLNWSSVVLADNYSIYQYSGLITTLNGSVLKLTTLTQLSYQISGLLDGTYYYVVIASNMSGSSNISNCESVVVKFPELPPHVAILQPTNGSIFLTINNLILNYYVENIPQIQKVWYMINSSGQWVSINGNTTFNVLFPGTHSIVVCVQSNAGQNYTSNPAVFKVFIENDPNASLEIAMVVISGAFQSGDTMEIQVSLSNKGSVDLANVVLYFDRSTSQYQFAPNSKNNYTISILSVNQMSVFTIKVILNQTTSELLIRGQLTAESFHESFEFPLKPESTTDPLVYTFSAVGVAAVAGGSFYGLKKKNAKGTKSVVGRGKLDKNIDKNEPSLNGNDNFEVTF